MIAYGTWVYYPVQLLLHKSNIVIQSHTTSCDAIDVQVVHTITVLSILRLQYCDIHTKCKQKDYHYYYYYFSLLCLSGIRR